MIKSEIEEYEDCLITTDWVKKSNLLINQIGARSSLLAEKVFLYSLTVIEKRGPDLYWIQMKQSIIKHCIVRQRIILQKDLYR